MLSLDPLAKRFLAICGLLFLLTTALKINGSSIFLWKERMHDLGSTGGLILSTPKAVRSDEWAVWTPAVLWQAEHSFPTENPSLGFGKVPLIYNLPVRYYTALFRPQFYGFLLLDIEHGYAWYWNAKVFGLLASMFLLLRMLTNNSLTSLFGAFWIYLSSYIQWWFSCPPMLPEMLSTWAIALLSAMIVMTTGRRRTRILAVFLFFVSVLDFALCLYPPFQIPLIYLGLILLFGFLYRHNDAGAAISWSKAAALLVGLAFLACALTLWPFFEQCRSTLQALALTSYPGLRRTYGGALSVRQLFSGVLNFFDSESTYPEEWGSINAAANFYPLWIPILAITWRDLVAYSRRRAIELGLLAFLLLGSIYAVCGLPRWLCDATLLSFCTEDRGILAIGVANIIFCVLSIAPLQTRLLQPRRNYLIVAAGFLALLLWGYLQVCAPANPKFFTLPRIVLLCALNLLIILALMKYPRRLFPVLFLSLLAASNLLVNPVMMGLGPLLTATPRAAIQSICRADPDGGWVAYDSNSLSDFIMSAGANVLSGVKLVPNLDFYRRIDPSGENVSIYNRYSFACFSLPPARGVIRITPLAFPTHSVEIEPSHPGFREEHVRYFVFPEELAGAETAGLKLLQSFPQNYVWIYKLNGTE